MSRFTESTISIEGQINAVILHRCGSPWLIQRLPVYQDSCLPFLQVWPVPCTQWHPYRPEAVHVHLVSVPHLIIVLHHLGISVPSRPLSPPSTPVEAWRPGLPPMVGVGPTTSSARDAAGNAMDLCRMAGGRRRPRPRVLPSSRYHAGNKPSRSLPTTAGSGLGGPGSVATPRWIGPLCSWKTSYFFLKIRLFVVLVLGRKSCRCILDPKKKGNVHVCWIIVSDSFLDTDFLLMFVLDNVHVCLCLIIWIRKFPYLSTNPDWCCMQADSEHYENINAILAG
jgi:hypothetical protein